ncbi:MULTISPECIES: NADPH:quinone oxidoreductase family protein [Roseomonadaceae]|uniref:NADPH:quinone oxidoreductase family protein n=1 Tax=Falsiroseomonas oleicola TaxID=2801474 RepID=A0ABS6H526_9PROT|nr:NADPH:quinone oxidoreductase family protein [Roseomonas oleicola]MBU8543797.1 NADPH:quinone oxidoreductase family protein [Roseomonas oleicola]
MRAAQVTAFGGPEAVIVTEVPRPAPGPGEVLVRVQAVSVNYVDLVVIAGRYQFVPPLPFTPGKGPAGIIEAVGEGVTAWAPGDRVLAMAEIGSYAEYTLAPANQCYRLPAAMPFTEAASMALAYDTAWFALRERARFQPGETVLVLGATGAVGLAAVALAKALGGRVLAGVSSASKAQLALDAGADAIIDLSQPDIRESLRAQVKEVAGAVDIVIDPLGDIYFEAALRALAWKGRLVVVGFAAGNIPTLKANYLLVKNIEVSGLQISDYRKRVPQDVAACFAEIFSLYERGLVKPAPATVMKLDDVAQALAMLRDRAVNGRIVLTP